MTQVSIKRDYQKFIILSTPRSGSQNLVYFLNSHTNVLSYSEPFQPYFNLGNPEKTLFENPLFFHMYKHLRSKIPLYFLKRIIFKKYPPHISYCISSEQTIGLLPPCPKGLGIKI